MTVRFEPRPKERDITLLNGLVVGVHRDELRCFTGFSYKGKMVVVASDESIYRMGDWAFKKWLTKRVATVIAYRTSLRDTEAVLRIGKRRVYVQKRDYRWRIKPL